MVRNGSKPYNPSKHEIDMSVPSRGKRSVQLALAILTIALCSGLVFADGSSGKSTWCSNPPSLDGVVSQGEWPDTPQLTMTRTRISFMNDQKFLYLLADVPNSTGNVVDDPAAHTWGDGIAVYVDVDRDGKKTFMVDFDYSWLIGQRTARSLPISDDYWTGGLTNTTSKIVWGFGPTPASSTSHRFFEIKLNLTEMRANPGDKVRLGFWVQSINPSFTDVYPAHPWDDAGYANYYELELSHETILGLEPIVFYSAAGLAVVCVVGAAAFLLTRRRKAVPPPPPPP